MKVNNIIKRFPKVFKRIINHRIEIDSKIYRREIYHYLVWDDDQYDLIFTISSIKAFKCGDKIIVEITTSRPGLLIGERGKNIDALCDFLKERLKQDVELKLKENKVFMDIY